MKEEMTQQGLPPQQIEFTLNMLKKHAKNQIPPPPAPPTKAKGSGKGNAQADRTGKGQPLAITESPEIPNQDENPADLKKPRIQ